MYSIDEVMIDATSYLHTYQMNAKELARAMIKDVYDTTGITATAGIGDNLYLCKVAMDIVAKHIEPDENGVRIAVLDEMSYRRLLWGHRPLTDFWRVGTGYAKKLEEVGLYTMGDVARCSLGGPDAYYNEELLYKMFGINAELLIDTHGAGSLAGCLISKPINRARTVLVRGRFFNVRILMKRRGLLCGRWRMLWRWIWWKNVLSQISLC